MLQISHFAFTETSLAGQSIEFEASSVRSTLARVNKTAWCTRSREQHAKAAPAASAAKFTYGQMGFVDFVLAQYVKERVDKLEPEKPATLLWVNLHEIR
jgi:hypothetical protein